MHSWMRNRSLEGPKRSVLLKLTNGNLIPQQHNPPAMPNYPTDRANGRDYIYRVKFSSTSSLRIGASAFVALERPSQSNLAAEGQDFDVLKVDLTCVYGLINLGWKAVERPGWRKEGTDRRLPPRLRPQWSMCFISYEYSEDKNVRCMNCSSTEATDNWHSGWWADGIS